MTALPPNPTTGNAKMGASMIAGAASIILIYLINRFIPPPPIPDYVQGAIQTILVSLAVWYTPHRLGGDS